MRCWGTPRRWVSYFSCHYWNILLEIFEAEPLHPHLICLGELPTNSVPFWPTKADDLSMFFATGVVLHRVLTMSTSKATTASVGISIATVLVVVAYLHCSRDELIIHHTTFGIMITTIGLKTMALIHKIENPLIQKKVYRLSRSGAGTIVSFLLFLQEITWL